MGAVIVLAIFIIVVFLFLLLAKPRRVDLSDDYLGFEPPAQEPLILYRPSAVYTKAALRHGVKGVVQLHVYVDADGGVSKIEPLKTLPDGLTDEAIKSARRIQFYPALASRKFMVPGDTIVEYSFP